MTRKVSHSSTFSTPMELLLKLKMYWISARFIPLPPLFIKVLPVQWWWVIYDNYPATLFISIECRTHQLSHNGVHLTIPPITFSVALQALMVTLFHDSLNTEGAKLSQYQPSIYCYKYQSRRNYLSWIQKLLWIILNFTEWVKILYFCYLFPFISTTLIQRNSDTSPTFLQTGWNWFVSRARFAVVKPPFNATEATWRWSFVDPHSTSILHKSNTKGGHLRKLSDNLIRRQIKSWSGVHV